MITQQQLLEGAKSIYEGEWPGDKLNSMGIEHAVRTSSFQDDRYNTTMYQHEMVYTFPQELPFYAIFTKEGLLDKVVKIFKSEMQVGDPIFDDNVLIKTSNEAMCRATLTDRFQGAVLNFVQQQGEVEIDDASLLIEFITESSEITQLEEMEHIILASHLIQWLL